MWIQMLVSIFVLFVLIRIMVNARERKISLAPATVWATLWIAIAIIFWLPGIASWLALLFGIGRGSDLIIYISIVIIFFIMYRVFIKVEKINRDITTIIRNLAIKNGSKKDQRSDSHSSL